MKQIAAIVITCLWAVPAFSQVTTPLPAAGGVGGGAGATYTLEQLRDSALQHNMSILAANHDIEAARQQRKEAFTHYFPTVSGTALTFNANRGMAKVNMDPQNLIPASMATTLSQMLPPELLAGLSSPISMSMLKSGTIASLMAMQPLFAGGQIVNGNRLAAVGEEASSLKKRLAVNEVELQTEQYYWQLVSLLEKVKTVDAVDSLLADIYKDVEVAVRAGVALRNDLLQVQLRRNDVASQRLKLQNGISIVKMLLGQYCGLKRPSSPSSPSSNPSSPTPDPSRGGEGSGYTFDIVLPDMSLQDTNGVSSSAMTLQNYILPSPPREGSGVGLVGPRVGLLPEYQLLEKQVEAARLQKRIEVGKRLPTVAVGAGYNYHNLMDNDQTFAMVFATVSVPISDWWGGSHAIKRRNIELQKAREQLEDNSQLLVIRMQKAANDVEEARQQLLLARQAIEQADENLRLERDRYRVGTSTMSSLLEAQLLQQQTHDKFTDAFAQLQTKLTEYRQATGQP